MDLTIHPGKLSGSITVIPSKSQAHRLLICAALSDDKTELICPETNQDIEATVSCLNALGADIRRTQSGYLVVPIRTAPKKAVMHCGESGSTLRFMLPVAGALGVDATFYMQGRLPSRPLSPLWEEMERMGCFLSRPTADTVRCTGKLQCGAYSIDGGVSSQYITGLLFAMALIPGESQLQITGKCESKPYIEMTQQALSAFGVHTDNYRVTGAYPFRSPGTVTVEGDWSNGAFFLAAKALGNDVTVLGLNPNSFQGDCAVSKMLLQLEHKCTISAEDTPDLVPVLAVAAGAKKGAQFINAGRLRLKESDRIESVASMLRALGAAVTTGVDTMTISPAKYHSCVIDSAGDHRIAMAAAIAATVADGPVTILNAECVAKSYPTFWVEYERLGGQYEQYIR